MIEIFNSVASNYCHKQKKTNIFSKGSLRVLIVQKKKGGGGQTHVYKSCCNIEKGLLT